MIGIPDPGVKLKPPVTADFTITFTVLKAHYLCGIWAIQRLPISLNQAIITTKVLGFFQSFTRNYP
jgi:hypothetical protein